MIRKRRSEKETLKRDMIFSSENLDSQMISLKCSEGKYWQFIEILNKDKYKKIIRLFVIEKSDLKDSLTLAGKLNNKLITYLQ